MPLIITLFRIKGLKYPPQVVGLNARTGICHLQHHIVTGPYVLIADQGAVQALAVCPDGDLAMARYCLNSLFPFPAAGLYSRRGEKGRKNLFL